MATITSTIRLVDQMTPTLRKISKAIDEIDAKARKLRTAFDSVSRGFEKANASANRTQQGARGIANAIATIPSATAPAVSSFDKLERNVNDAGTKTSKLRDKLQQCWQTLSKLAKTYAFNNLVNGASRSTNYVQKLYNALRRVFYLLLTLRGLRVFIDAADSMMNTTARLDLINDGLASTDAYINRIYQSAQNARTGFGDMAKMVSKLGMVAGPAFGGNVNRMIKFAENVSKVYRTTGVAAEEASAASLQLTQALGSGVLQGEELKSLLEHATPLVGYIADYLGVATGEVKKLAAEGKITSDVVVAAIEGATDKIDRKFNKLKKTIGDVWTEIKNYSLMAFLPVIRRIQSFINSPAWEAIRDRIYGIIDSCANAVIWLFNLLQSPQWTTGIDKVTVALGNMWNAAKSIGTAIVNICKWIGDNWSWLSGVLKVIIGLTIALKVATLAVAAARWVLMVADMMETTVSVTGFLKVLGVIMLVIGAIYLVVWAINQVCGTSISATGLILGIIAFIVVLIYDAVIAIIDSFKAVWYVFLWIGDSITLAAVQAATQIFHAFMNCVKFVLNIFSALGSGIGEILLQIGNMAVAVFDWVVGSIQYGFYTIALYVVTAFNDMVYNAGSAANEMLKPFVSLANLIIDCWNAVARAWNSTIGSISFTVPDWVPGIGGKSWSGSKLTVASHISAGDVIRTGSKLETSLAAKKAAAGAKISNSYATINDGFDWGKIGNAFVDGFHEFEYVDPFKDTDRSEADKLNQDLVDKLNGLYNFSNPIEAAIKWYKIGDNIGDGVSGFINGVGDLWNAIFNGDWSTNNAWSDNVGSILDNIANVAKNNGLTNDALNDLLNGKSPSNNNSGLLGDIANNTGNSAGSAGNIEDTLDLAEEELELLRKLAEQEVINRFTTAEIHVDMTNNNNISSKMDLDGIVTHLSNKLYEELGVVASGVHY